MRIATMATGGIGGFLAVRLGLAGHEVATIARGAHLDAIRDDGLVLDGTRGMETLHPWMATDDPAQVGPVDVILFGVKGDALEDAARASIPMLGSDTVVVPFLNGVEACDRLLNILPEANVANGLAQISTTIVAPGLIKQTGEFNNFVFAERDSRRSKRIEALRSAIIDAGSNAPATDDIERDVWSKFILFSAVSGVTAAAHCTIEEITTLPELGALFRSVIAETSAIARARGIAIPNDAEDKIWETVQHLPKPMRASTAIDLENGRPLEIEWISGAAVRLARQAGLEAPSNRTLYAVLLPHIHGK